jgi:hypothetical protein
VRDARQELVSAGDLRAYSDKRIGAARMARSIAIYLGVGVTAPRKTT